MLNLARSRPAPSVRHPNRHQSAFTAADLQAAQILRRVAAESGISLPEATEAAEMTGLGSVASAMRELSR